MNILGLVPARGGSVRVPRKNLEKLGGLTLVERAVLCGMESKVLATVVVSTEDKEIAAVAAAMKTVVINRPDELCGPESPMLHVVGHAIRAEKDSGRVYDAVALLQPTSPLRTWVDVAACVRMLEECNADAVVSVTACADPEAFLVRHAGRLEKVPSLVVPNGAVFILRTDAIERGEDWFSGHCYAYQMPKDRSLDVDTPLDLEYARLALEKATV